MDTTEFTTPAGTSTATKPKPPARKPAPAKKATTAAAISPKSPDATIAAALAAMQAQIDALSAENAALKAAPAVAENEKFAPVDLDDPQTMAMMERRENIPTHHTTGAPIFNPLRAAVPPQK